MNYASVAERLSGLGGDKWDIHIRARAAAAAGRDVIELTIGEPDTPTPPALIDVAADAMRAGRTAYSDGRGEADLLDALAARYTTRLGRPFGPENFLCFPGTQTALFTCIMAVAEAGDEVLVGDPLYATYEGVIASSGAQIVRVPLREDRGFRIAAEDIAAKITPRSRAILLNAPHNPTGSILDSQDLREICELARDHDLWVISDEVYEDLVFDGAEFTSALSLPEFEDRVVSLSSISKSHAAPGFRSGWCVGSVAFTQRVLPLSETMLFGNQPFIADMTAAALSGDFTVAADMAARYASRAKDVQTALAEIPELRVHMPGAGMFCLLDVSATGMSGYDFALSLLNETGVAVMPGNSFGETLQNWVRLSLTVEDAKIREACARIAAFAKSRVKDAVAS